MKISLKKKTYLTICIIFIATTLLFSSLIYTYVPKKYDIYVNGNLIDYAWAYECYGHIYIPVLGTMQIYGYEVEELDSVSSFIIDDIQYCFSVEEEIIYTEDQSYLGVMSGKCFLHMCDSDLHVLVGEINYFFEQIGEDPIPIAKTDRFRKCIYFEIDLPISS